MRANACLSRRTEALALQHDAFSRNTRNQLKQVFDAIRDLMSKRPAKTGSG